jgi:hypothetical protein
MSSGERQIRRLEPAEIQELVEWAAAEGWNPGFEDAAAFRTADPDGFIGAFVDGEMVAGISAVCYDETFGFIGLYISRPDKRGKGHGRAVWNAGMARLGSRTIGLDGVPEQQANYRSMGFVPAYRTVRFSGRFAGATFSPGETRQVTRALFPSLLAFDRQFFPAARPAFLEHWLGPPHRALAIIRDGEISAYGVVRRCRHGFKVGPLFADEMEYAVTMLGQLSAACGFEEIHIDVPEMNRGFIDILTAARLSSGFETARMYRGKPPKITATGVFGVTSLELG